MNCLRRCLTVDPQICVVHTLIFDISSRGRRVFSVLFSGTLSEAIVLNRLTRIQYLSAAGVDLHHVLRRIVFSATTISFASCSLRPFCCCLPGGLLPAPTARLLPIRFLSFHQYFADPLYNLLENGPANAKAFELFSA